MLGLAVLALSVQASDLKCVSVLEPLYVCILVNRTATPNQQVIFLYMNTNEVNVPQFQDFGEIFASYSDIENLAIIDKSLRKLDRNFLKGIKDITSINLSRNNIVEVDANSFSDITNLKEIQLSNNSIELVHEHAFNNLEQLEVLDLSLNSIEILKSETFAHLSNLMVLSLSRNYIKHLKYDLFHSLASIKWLDLNHNLIEHLDKDLFVHNLKVQAINLDDNRISVIHPQNFHLPTGCYLSLHRNVCVNELFWHFSRSSLSRALRLSNMCIQAKANEPA